MTDVKKKIKPSRIPRFKNYEEEAKFWDTHSAADYLDELKPARRVRFAKNLSQGITIRLDDKTLTELREVASKKGVGPTTLARMWIKEYLQNNYNSNQTG